jgi:hypothetical protein
MLKKVFRKWILIIALLVLGSMPCFWAIAESKIQHPKASPNAWPEGDKRWPPPGAWHEGDKKWPDIQDMMAKRLDWTYKRLEQAKSSQTGSESEFLFPRVSNLLERSKVARENPFQFERLMNASDALLNAGDFISWSKKTEKTSLEKDFFGVVGMAIEGCYHWVEKADLLAPWSGEKNPEKYIKLARTLYQQARGAYDAHDYMKAKFLADASVSVVVALESITQSVPHIPK